MLWNKSQAPTLLSGIWGPISEVAKWSEAMSVVYTSVNSGWWQVSERRYASHRVSDIFLLTQKIFQLMVSDILGSMAVTVTPHLQKLCIQTHKWDLNNVGSPILPAHCKLDPHTLAEVHKHEGDNNGVNLIVLPVVPAVYNECQINLSWNTC